MENFKYIIMVLFLSILVGCKSPTKVLEMPIEKTKIEYITQLRQDSFIQKDSIYVHDSVYIIEKEGTIIETRFKEAIKLVYKDRYINQIDTFIQIDSIDRPVIVEKEVEVNKLTWWQKVLMYCGGGAILGIVTKLYFKFKKWF